MLFCEVSVLFSLLISIKKIYKFNLWGKRLHTEAWKLLL